MIYNKNLFNNLTNNDHPHTYKRYGIIQKKKREGLKIENEIGDFDYKECFAWKMLQHYYSTGVRHNELLGIAQILQEIVELPPINRACKRSFVVLLKWYENNWKIIEHYLPYITLCDDNYIPINDNRSTI